MTAQFANADANVAVPHHIMTQVQRPGTSPNKDQSGQQNDMQGNLQDANVDKPCCWFCLPICGLRPKDRNAPQTELSKANERPTQNALNLEQPPRGAYDDAPAAEQEDHREVTPASESRSALIPGLLGQKTRVNKGKKCLVLDLDETLVHSSFKPVNNADFIVPVEIDGVCYKVYVLKRPYVDEFLIECAKYYELVVFTASLSKYANPLLDMLDTSKVIEHRLFRESCVLHGQAYVKDLSKLGRRMEDIIFVDNSPLSYAFHPTSAVPILSWFDDPHDEQLRELLPVLCDVLTNMHDVRNLLDANNKSFEWLCQQSENRDAYVDPKRIAGGKRTY